MPGKRKRADVAEFSLHLMQNISDLHRDLADRSYRHGSYAAFKINDPKPRDIHKASVRDRLVHHAVYRILYPYFDQKFIFDSYSCRIGKGTYRATERFITFARKASLNHTRTVWVLKCDIKKFFANINHKILKGIVERNIGDGDTVRLIAGIVGSFSVPGNAGRGLLLGNLTSQLLVNIYMNEFDQYVKRSLKVKYYIRYADDFVLLSEDRQELEDWLLSISTFLEETLKLSLHPDKVYIRTFASGIDFLGWIHFPDHRVIRSSTRQRMCRRMAASQREETYQSYRGLLGHGNGWKAKRALDSVYLNQD